jgi:hypothetical protein
MSRVATRRAALLVERAPHIMMMVIAVPVLEVLMIRRLRKPAWTSAHRNRADSTKLYGGEVTLDIPFNNTLPTPDPGSAFIVTHEHFVDGVRVAFDFTDAGSESIAGVFGFVTTDELLQGGQFSQFFAQFNDLFGGELLPRLFGPNPFRVLNSGFRVDDGTFKTDEDILRLETADGRAVWSLDRLVGGGTESARYGATFTDAKGGHAGSFSAFDQFVRGQNDPAFFADAPLSLQDARVHELSARGDAGSLGDLRALAHTVYDTLQPMVPESDPSGEVVTESTTASPGTSTASIDLQSGNAQGSFLVEGSRTATDGDGQGAQDQLLMRIIHDNASPLP